MSPISETLVARWADSPNERLGASPGWRVPRSVESQPQTVDETQAERIAELARRLLDSDEALRDPRWRRRVVPGLGAGPACIFEDHSEIPLAPSDSHTLEYRMSWFARGTDIVALADERVPAFERYLASDLDLGRITVIQSAPRPRAPLARRLVDDPAVLEKLIGLAGSRGGLTLVPYISTRSVWLLGELLARLTGENVRVAGPPPDLTERVNNKLWFSQRVRDVLGAEALPRTHVASDERELRTHLDALASLGGRLVVKAPSGSGGRGIVAFEATAVDAVRIEPTVHWIREVLSRGGWDGRYPLVVGRWDAPVVASPSVQVWIPHLRSGLPVIEAIFDQMLDGVRFMGASTTELPVRVRSRLHSDGLRLAMLFQQLGYFGRCSFDSVLVGAEANGAQIHWLECNGRWGSVSTALTAIKRIVGVRPDRPFAVLQSEVALGRERSLAEVFETLGTDAFHRRTDGTGALILSPRRVMAGTGLNLAVVSRSAAEARASAGDLLHRLTERA